MIGPITVWSVGLINGYKYKENGLPNYIKYGTISLGFLLGLIKIMAHMDESKISHYTLGKRYTGACMTSMFIMGTYFCLGDHLGKAICYAEDTSSINKDKIVLKLF